MSLFDFLFGLGVAFAFGVGMLCALIYLIHRGGR